MANTPHIALLLTPAAIAAWMRRIDAQEPGVMSQLRQPVDKFAKGVIRFAGKLQVAFFSGNVRNRT